MNKLEFIEEAKTWKGTKWRHGQALKGDSTDCIQWIGYLGKQFGFIPKEYKFPRYSRDWALHNNFSILKQEISKFCYKKDIMEKGDILLFIFGKTSSHAGIYLGNNEMIHSHIKNGVEIINLNQHINKTEKYIDILDSIWCPNE